MNRIVLLLLTALLATGCTAAEIAPTSSPPAPTTTTPATATNIPAPPSPSTPVITPQTDTAVPPAAIHHIIDGASGLIVGASVSGEWLPVNLIAPPAPGAVYNSYVASAPAGFAAIDSILAANPVCPQATAVAFADPVPLGSTLLGQPAWDVTPRQPEALAADTDVYATAVRDWLQANGIAEPDVVIDAVWRVDLEGDGVDEVIISAARIASELALPPAAAGDYSLVLLRQVKGDAVVETAVAASIYPEAEELGYPWRYRATNVLDLNGDGVLEIVISGARYEGRASRVIAMQNGRPREVLSVSCPN